MTDNSIPSSRLLSIPPEIREHIYRFILSPEANRIPEPNEHFRYDYPPALVLFRINKQIYLESRQVFRDLNVFVRIETPWPEARHHVAREGHVPIVAAGRSLVGFAGHAMSVRIDAPDVALDIDPEQAFLVLVDDVPKFTQMWFYSNLSYSSLNPQLRLTLRLRDPFRAAHEPKRVPESLQRRLLLPFGRVRNLRAVVVGGDPKPCRAVEEEMREMQAAPLDSPEHCLRAGTRLKLEGNDQLARGNYRAALERYRQAWLAIHVVIAGRERHIHGDRFFGVELREEPYRGKNGQAERLILRVQLVANTCQVYLKMEDYDECVYWGQRTIRMLREAMGVDDGREMLPEDEAVLGFPAANEMGKVYYRTGLAMRELDRKDEARKLLRVASIYLPRDEAVGKALASVALRLG